VQSPARPFGLDIVDQVALAASDTESADFQANTLPSMAPLINENLGTYDPDNDFVAIRPDSLTLAVAADVRVYFVDEATNYHNSLGFNTGGGGIGTGNPLLIFPAASRKKSKRKVSEPLLPGDFVATGQFDSGTHLDFFLVSDGAGGGTDVFSTQKDLNLDGIDHVVALAQVQSPYLLLGFEDQLGGGDNDLNDLLSAVYLGEENVQWLIDHAAQNGVPAPEPSTIWILVAVSAAWLYRARRKKRLAMKKHDSRAGTMGERSAEGRPGRERGWSIA